MTAEQKFTELAQWVDQVPHPIHDRGEIEDQEEGLTRWRTNWGEVKLFGV